MKRLTLLLFCLLLGGCSTVQRPASTFAGLTIEAHPLTRDGERGVFEVVNVLVAKPELREKRRPWRDLPVTNGVALTLSPDEQMRLLHDPIKVADTVVYVRVNDQSAVEVVADDKVVYTYTHPNATRVASPRFLVQGLTAWDGKWVLETPQETVIVAGESLNDRLGYKQIFGFRMIAGKPFFFFRHGGQVRLSYDGQVLPLAYDQVPHYGCCDADGFNPQGSERMVSFYGLSGGVWHFVDIGSY